MADINEWTDVHIADQDEYAKKHSSPASLQTIVDAANVGDNQRVIVDMVLINGTADGTLELYDSDGTVIDGYYWVFSGQAGMMLDGKYFKKTPLGKGLKYTTTGGGDHSVMFKTHLRNEG